MQCNIEASNFVAKHVEEFTTRHWQKINQLNPEKSSTDLILESGNAAMIKNMQQLDRMEQEIENLQEQLYEAARKFHNQYDEIINELMDEHQTERMANIRAAQAEFEHKIRRAIGLVELVGTKEAYEVLEACRQEIYQLGK